MRESRAKKEGLVPVVYRYAVHSGTVLPDTLLAELGRRRDLQVTLVQIERDLDQRLRDLWAAHPVTVPLVKEAEAAEEEVTSARKELRAAKARARTPRPDDARVAALKDARDRAKSARLALKEAKTVLRPQVREQLRALETERNAAVKGTYGAAVAAGLYWATVNDTTGRHRTAVQRVISLRSQGRPAQVRFPPRDGTGTLAVQLQRQAGDPPRVAGALAESKWRNVAALQGPVTEGAWSALPSPERKRACLVMRIGSGDHAQMVTLPLVYHRPLPDGADITEIRLTRYRTGPSRKWSVSFTCLVPPPPARGEGALRVAHTGWRSLPDGSLRVAVVTPPDGPLPRDLTELVRPGERWAEVVIPARVRGEMEHLEDIQGKRDRHLNEIRAWLAGWQAGHPDLAAALMPDSVARWRSPARFAVLALRLREDCPPGAEEAAVRLEAWRAYDKHLWAWVTHGQAKMVRWRRNAYRNLGAWLCRDAAVIVTDEWDAGRRLPDVTEEDTRQQRAARRNAVIAAPGQLRDAIRQAAQRRGVRTAVPAEADRGVHHGCPRGGTLPREARAEHVLVRCAGCDRMVDQDVNALRIMAAAASA